MQVMKLAKAVLPARTVARLRQVRQRGRTAARAYRSGSFYQLAIAERSGFLVAYRSGTADENVLQDSFDRDIFFAGAPEYVPAPEHVVLDVGAHIGTFTLLAASKVPAGKVYAVEASQETYDLLRINIALNKAGNVVASHLALADGPGTTVLHHDLTEGNWGHSIMKRLSRVGERVGTESLASYMDRHGVDSVDFIKFNCEGAEFPILLGTEAEILRRIRTMLILYHCELAEGYSLDRLLRHLHEAGFRTRLSNQSATRGWILASLQTPLLGRAQSARETGGPLPLSQN